MWNVRSDQTANRKPCTNWDVTAPTNYFVTQQLSYASTIKGAPVKPGRTPRESLDPAAEAILRAVRAPAGLENIVQGRADPISASKTLESVVLDLAQRAWGLARATGEDSKLDPVVIEAVFPNAEAIAARGPQRSRKRHRQEQFLALTGRDPATVL